MALQSGGARVPSRRYERAFFCAGGAPPPWPAGPSTGSIPERLRHGAICGRKRHFCSVLANMTKFSTKHELFVAYENVFVYNRYDPSITTVRPEGGRTEKKGGISWNL